MRRLLLLLVAALAVAALATTGASPAAAAGGVSRDEAIKLLDNTRQSIDETLALLKGGDAEQALAEAKSGYLSHFELVEIPLRVADNDLTIDDRVPVRRRSAPRSATASRSTRSATRSSRCATCSTRPSGRSPTPASAPRRSSPASRS